MKNGYSPILFNIYTENIMRDVLDDEQIEQFDLLHRRVKDGRSQIRRYSHDIQVKIRPV